MTPAFVVVAALTCLLFVGVGGASAQVIVHDTFTATSGSSITSHVPDNVPVAGTTWTYYVGATPTIVNGAVSSNATGTINGSGHEATFIQSGTADGTVGVSVKASVSPTIFGLGVRKTSGGYLIIRYTSTGPTPKLELLKYTGSWSWMTSVTAPMLDTNWHRLEAVLSGSTITAKLDNVTIFTVTETFNQTATEHGLMWDLQQDYGTTFDNFDVTGTGPTISSLSPAAAPIGASVTVAGTNFGASQGSSTLKFNGVTAAPTAWSATSITALVPATATTGNVVVTVNSVASSGVAFTVTPNAPSGSIIYETFTGADGTGLASHVPDIGPSGSVWTSWAPSSVASLQGGRGGITSIGTTGHQPWVLQSNLADVIVAADFTSTQATPRAGGLIIRGTDYNNYIALVTDTTIFALYKKVGGTFTLLGQVTPPLNASTTYRYEVWAQGSTIQAYLNGTLQLTVTETFQSTATRHGVFFHSADLTARLDNFSVVPIAGTPTISSLSPAAAPVGATVTLAGSNFGASQGSSTVKFNGVTATPMAWSNASITVPVPATATNGNVVVNVNSVNSNGVSFTVTPAAPSGSIIYDTFTGADGTGLASHVPDIAPAASVWTSWATTSYASLQAGKVGLTSAGTTGHQPWLLQSNVADVIATADYVSTQASRLGGIVVRGSDSNNFIGLYTDGTNVTIYKKQAGTFTLLGQATPPINAGTTYTYQLRTRGSTLQAYVNGTLLLTVTESFNSTATYHGVYFNSTDMTARLDNFSVAPNTSPVISSISPAAAPVGAPVTITGSNFWVVKATTTTIKFNGITATPTAWADGSVTVSVPPTATTGNVVITVDGVASNGMAFTVSPTILSLTPTSGSSGASVTVSGNNFGTSQGTSTIAFNGAVATPSSWNASTIVAPVPAGATTGNVVVTVGGFASSGVAFTVPPTISSRAPTSGTIGTSVTITGTNFGGTQGSSTVTFNSVAATPTSWSQTSIVVPVPTGATTGNIVVNVGGVASGGVTFGVNPAVSSLSPTAGAVGSSVTIAGTTFGASQGTSTVTFNGVPASISSWTASSIVATVPATATTGNVVVTVGGVASNAIAFTLAPGVSSLSPSSGLIGTSVVIAGTNFGSSQGASTVTFNGIPATPSSWAASGNSITVPVPSGATTGNVVVTVGGVGSNGSPFSVSTTSGVVVHDSFVGVSGALVTSHAPETSPSGAVWTSFAGAVPIIVGINALGSNATGPIGGSGHESVFYETGVSNAIVAASFKPSVTNTIFGVTARNNGSSFYIVRYTSITSPKLELMFYNGSWSSLVSQPAAAIDTNWHRVEARLTGTTIVGVLDNVVVFTYNSATNNQTATRHGLMWDLERDAAGLFDDFDVTVSTAAPAISSVSPAGAAVGASVTITGLNFGATQGTSTVKFNGVPAAATWGSGTLVATIPVSASTGNLVVNVGGLNSNAYPFTVTVPSTTAVYDTFTGVTGASLGSHLPDTGPAGVAWTAVAGAVPAISNGAVSSNATGPIGAFGLETAVIASGMSDGLISVDFKPASATTVAGLTVRATDTTHFFALRYSLTGGNPVMDLYKYTGAWTLLKSVEAPVIGAGSWHQLQARLEGTSITGLLDGAPLLSYSTSYNQTGSMHGLYWDLDRDPGVVFDTFQVSQLTAAPSVPSDARVFDEFTISGASQSMVGRVPTISYGGAPWLLYQGEWPTLNGSKVLPTGTSTPYVVTAVDSGTANGTIYADFESTGANRRVGLALRIDDADNMLLLQYSGNWSNGRVDLIARVNGVFKNITGVSVGPLDGPHRLEAWLNGLSISARLDGRFLFNVNKNDNLTSTRHGLFWWPSADGTASVDRFAVSGVTPALPLPAGTVCEGSLSRWVIQMDSNGGTQGLDVTMPHPGCVWTTRMIGGGSTYAVMGGGGPFGGNQTIQFSVGNAASPDLDVVYGSVAGHLVYVLRAGETYGSCAYSVSPSSLEFPIGGDSKTISISASPYYRCTWTVSPDYRVIDGAGWLGISDGSLHNTAGSVTITVPPNTEAGERTAYLTIGNRLEFAIHQAGNNAPGSCATTTAPGTVNVGPFEGIYNIAVSAPSGCSWSASTGSSFLHLSPTSGSGPGTVDVTVDANTSSSDRTGTVTVAGISVTFVQVGAYAEPPEGDGDIEELPPGTDTEDPTIYSIHWNSSAQPEANIPSVPTIFEFMPLNSKRTLHIRPIDLRGTLASSQYANVKMTMYVLPDGGGHIFSAHTGTLNGMGVTATCYTGISGDCKFDVQSGQWGQVAMITFEVTSQLLLTYNPPLKLLGSVYVYMGVNNGHGLTEMAASPVHKSVGQTSRHQLNMFGTPNFVQSLAALSSAYHQAFPLLEVVCINDMSLPLGGFFDAPTGNPSWSAKTHTSHKNGVDADIRTTTGSTPAFGGGSCSAGILWATDPAVRTWMRANISGFFGHSDYCLEYPPTAPYHLHVRANRRPVPSPSNCNKF